MITVGAATLAAVFFIMNLDNPYSGTTPAWVKACEAAVAMAAMSLYGRLVLQASMSLANPEQLMGGEEVDLKKRQTQKVLGSFWVMIVLTGFLVFIRVMVPAFLEAIYTTGEQQSTQPPSGRQLPENGSDPEEGILFLEGGPPHELGAHLCCFREGRISGVALEDRNG